MNSKVGQTTAPSIEMLNKLNELNVAIINEITDMTFDIGELKAELALALEHTKVYEAAEEDYLKECEKIKDAYIALSIKVNAKGARAMKSLYNALHARYKAEATKSNSELKPINEWEIEHAFIIPDFVPPKFNPVAAKKRTALRRLAFRKKNHYVFHKHWFSHSRAMEDSKKFNQILQEKELEKIELENELTLVSDQINDEKEYIQNKPLPDYNYVYEDAFQDYVCTVRGLLSEYENPQTAAENHPANSVKSWWAKDVDLMTHRSINAPTSPVVPSLRRMSGPDINVYPYGNSDIRPERTPSRGTVIEHGYYYSSSCNMILKEPVEPIGPFSATCGAAELSEIAKRMIKTMSFQSSIYSDSSEDIPLGSYYSSNATTTTQLHEIENAFNKHDTSIYAKQDNDSANNKKKPLFNQGLSYTKPFARKTSNLRAGSMVFRPLDENIY